MSGAVSIISVTNPDGSTRTIDLGKYAYFVSKSYDKNGPLLFLPHGTHSKMGEPLKKSIQEAMRENPDFYTDYSEKWGDYGINVAMLPDLVTQPDGTCILRYIRDELSIDDPTACSKIKAKKLNENG